MPLDAELAAKEPTFNLLQKRYGLEGTTTMIVTNVTTMLLTAEFRSLLESLLKFEW